MDCTSSRNVFIYRLDIAVTPETVFTCYILNHFCDLNFCMYYTNTAISYSAFSHLHFFEVNTEY